MSRHPLSHWLWLSFGRRPQKGDLVVFFSARLDETGTDGRSPYVIVAGGISPPQEWDRLELSWGRLMDSRGVTEFHTKEYLERSEDFAGWGDLKCANFVKAQEKIIRKTVAFSVAVAVERETHARIKNKWRGVKNFRGDSDYGLCFRVARFLICERVAELISPNSKVQFLVESGPYAANAGTIYEEILRTKNAKYRPAKYAGMLGGFQHVPKGVLRSLEAADYLAGRAIADLEAGRFINPGRPQQVSLLMNPDFLEAWNEGMVKEREHRRAHGQRKPKPAA